MDMTVVVDKSENCTMDLSVGIPSQELDRRKDEILVKLSERVALPGFRKGRVPKAILEKQFGPQAMAEGLDELLKDAVREVIEQKDLHPVDTPKVTDLKTDDSRIQFKLSLEVRPQLQLTDKDILRIPLPKPPEVAVTEEDITRAIENELKGNSTFVPVLEPRSCHTGDFVSVDYEGFLKDGDKPIEGGKAEGVLLEVGGMKFLPGFDEQLVGMSPSDKRRVDVNFPADFYDDALQGKSAYFHVTLKSIKKRQMPEATDEWAKEHGYENMAAARAKIREEMEKGSKEMAKEELRRALFEVLDARIQMELPKVLVTRQMDELQKNIERQYKGGRKEVLDRLAKEGKSEADLEAEIRARAQRQIKNSLILDAVGKLKKIQVNDKEIEERLAQMAEQYQTTLENVRAELEKHDRLGEIRYAILDEKVVQFLLDHADIR